jgi:hypothetical protein
MTASFILVINRLKTAYYPYLFGGVVLIVQMYMVLKDRVEIALDWSKAENSQNSNNKQHSQKSNNKQHSQRQNMKESDRQ